MLEQTIFGIEIASMLPLIGAVSAAGTVIVVWFSLLERDGFSDRLIALQERRSTLKAEQLVPRKRDKIETPSPFRQIIRWLRLAGQSRVRAAQKKLAQAGHRSARAAHILIGARVLSPIVTCAVLVLLASFYGFMDQFTPKTMLVLGLVGFIGFMGPDIYLKNLVQKRQEAITKSLPDGFDLLVICADAGLSLDASLDRVANEMKKGAPELADELALTSIELSFLPERQAALHGLSERVPLQGIRALVNTFVQTERFGTPLAQALKVMASELRNERMMRAEEKAARLPAVLTVPMIVFILPPLFVVLLGPAIIRSMDALQGVW